MAAYMAFKKDLHDSHKHDYNRPFTVVLFNRYEVALFVHGQTVIGIVQLLMVK